MKRVFVISQQTLFGRGIESLLQEIPDIEIIGCKSDLVGAVAQLHEQSPDVVILYGHFPHEDLTPAMQWVLSNDNARIIRLNPESNSLGMYFTERRTITELDDLIEAITGSLSTDHAKA